VGITTWIIIASEDVEGIPVGVAPMMLLLADALPVVDASHFIVPTFVPSRTYLPAPPRNSPTRLPNTYYTGAISSLPPSLPLAVPLSRGRHRSLRPHRTGQKQVRRDGKDREKKRKKHRHTIFMSARSPGPHLATHQSFFKGFLMATIHRML